jgi:Ca2+-binding RTX toxin-like protein
MNLNRFSGLPHHVEPLEPRRFLTTVVIQQEALHIIGTARNDSIVLRMDPDDILQRNMQVHIGGDMVKNVDTAKFGRIRVNGRGGHDLLQIDETFGTIVMPLTINGGGGNDVLTGGSGDDELLGDGGQDTLSGSHGHDVLDGGPGHDVLIGQTGNDSLFGRAGMDYLDAGDGDDYLDGAGAFDTLLGGAGNDRLFGRGGDDLLYGIDGSDLLDGGPGNDDLAGGAAHDTIIGGAGHDQFDPGDDATEVVDRRVEES